MSTPQSTIYVCSGVRLDSRYQNSIYFESENLQRAFFMSKVVKQFSTYSYIRKTWNIKLHATLEEAYKWNYLFFHNSEDGKWYYYFINHTEYVNDATVELTLEMDVIQTYLFEFALLPSFVERQHTDSDEIGEHTIAEDLELGEIVTNNFYNFAELDGADLRDLCILILATQNPKSGSSTVSKINNVFNGMGVYAVNLDKYGKFGSLLKDLDKDIIVTMWMYPKDLIEIDTVESSGWDDSENIIHTVIGVESLDFTAKKNRDIDGYTPVNKKLYTFPYNYLYVTNNNGTSAIYHYERFTNDRCEFTVTGGISPDSGIRLTPNYYKGSSTNYEEGITLVNYPTCAWNADAYKIWLAQNQNQHNLAYTTAGLSVAGGAIAAIAGLATGNMIAGGAGATMAMSGMNQISSMLAQKKDMQAQPPQAKGSHSTNINVGNGYHLFTAYFNSVNAEQAKVIDDFFSMYGYKLNRVFTPKLLTRKFYTYTKTVGCQITSKNKGGMCNDDKVKIESIFDNGITFWRNGDIVGDYVACYEANVPT